MHCIIINSSHIILLASIWYYGLAWPDRFLSRVLIIIDNTLCEKGPGHIYTTH